MPNDPYTVAAKLLDAGPDNKPSRPAPAPPVKRAAASSAPDVMVGKKYDDPQSREDEQYMTGAVKRINQRIEAGNERMSGEYTKRRFNDRRYGRRSSR